MKVLVVGSGGREHALAWKISQSPELSKLYAAPGNPGIASCADCVNIAADNVAGLLEFVKKEGVDLTVVGPEGPLVDGIVDVFQRAGHKIFGPSKRAAWIEGSKVFAKKLMRSFCIPTASFQVFDDYEASCAYVETRSLPLVVKADGLAAGKGVRVCATREEALEAVRAIMKDRVFGSAGSQVIVENCLKGEEASILAFSDGTTIYPMESSQDHKAVFDDDRGPNTGGMGAYSPAPIISAKAMDAIERDILIPAIHGMNHEGRPYRGVLYAGVMVTEEGMEVLEFNCRFGDPETQPVLMRLKSDLLPVLLAVTERRLEEVTLEWDTSPAVCVVMASGGYPGKYDKGMAIEGIADAEEDAHVKVFHAGTALVGGRLVTAGGRVLGVTAVGKDLADAKRAAYNAVGKIHFKGAHFRKDIADKAFKR
ncbi:MAG: phosphoribosylamine--glycine ligase [Planctomycetota bacterium]